MLNKPNPTEAIPDLIKPRFETDLTKDEVYELGFNEDDNVTIVADIKRDENEQGWFSYACNASFKVNGHNVDCGDHEDFALQKSIDNWAYNGQFGNDDD